MTFINITICTNIGIGMSCVDGRYVCSLWGCEVDVKWSGSHLLYRGTVSGNKRK